MCLDGHIASLFLNHPVLNANQGLITFVINSPKPTPERVTLTLNAINQAKHKTAVVTGEGKSTALVKEVIKDKNTSHPIREVQNLVWYLDKGTAFKL